MKKSIVVVFCTLLILFCLSCYSYSENLRKEQQQIQTQIDASNIELELVKEDLSNLVYEISDLNDKIVSEEIEIENLKTQEASLT